MGPRDFFLIIIQADKLTCAGCDGEIHMEEHATWIRWGRALLHGRCFEMHALALNPLWNIWCQILVYVREVREWNNQRRLRPRIAAAVLAEEHRRREAEKARSKLSHLERAFEPDYD